jgi:hypothetical protein
MLLAVTVLLHISTVVRNRPFAQTKEASQAVGAPDASSRATTRRVLGHLKLTDLKFADANLADAGDWSAGVKKSGRGAGRDMESIVAIHPMESSRGEKRGMQPAENYPRRSW